MIMTALTLIIVIVRSFFIQLVSTWTHQNILRLLIYLFKLI